MNKQEFLAQLKEGLAGLPQEDTAERLAFYGEMIDDRMEEGLTEEEAVAGIGPIPQVVAQIVEDIPLSRLVKEKVAPKKGRRGWEIALIVIGFPIWFPLLIAAAAIVFSLYVVLWALVVSLWAVELALWAASAACLAVSVVRLLRGDLPAFLALLGACLLIAGISIFLFYAFLSASKGAMSLTKAIGRGIKRLFIGKENK